MITPDHIEETTSKPIQLDVTHIDLAVVEDDTGAEFVIMRLIEATGLVLDVPIQRHQAEAFGESLRAYAQHTLALS